MSTRSMLKTPICVNPSRVRRGPWHDCSEYPAGDCDLVPSVLFGRAGQGTVEEDSDTLTLGRLGDLRRVFDHVQLHGERESAPVSTTVSSGTAEITFTNTKTGPFAGIEIVITGRIADLQSAILTITTAAGNFARTRANGQLYSLPARNVRVRFVQLSATLVYIYVPFIKQPVLGVEDNQPSPAHFGSARAGVDVTISGFSGDGLTVTANLVTANSAELLRMGAAVTSSFSDE